MIHLYWIPFYFLLGIIFIFVFYYLCFAIVYLLVPEKVIPRVATRKTFMCVIPAHNEEKLIGRTLEHMLAVNYPRDLFQIVVVADNCNDRTAAIAADHDVLVMQRQDCKYRGKGYALSWALPRLAGYDYDAILIIDADTIVDRDYLLEMNYGLCAGNRVLQGYNNLLNRDDNYLTRLMHVTNVLKNLLFNEGRTRLGLSVSLMGTGMCFEKGVLKEYGWGAHSIGEDWEYFAKLTDHGVTVTFLLRAVAYSEEATSLRQGFSQRLRWAGGKFDVISRYGLHFLWRGIRERNWWKVETVLSLIAPPFSQLAYLNVLAAGVALVYPATGPAQAVRVMTVLLLGLQIAYFVIGLIVMRASARTMASIIVSPYFLCWKLVVDLLALAGYRRRDWVRTDRNIHNPQ